MQSAFWRAGAVCCGAQNDIFTNSDWHFRKHSFDFHQQSLLTFLSTGWWRQCQPGLNCDDAGMEGNVEKCPTNGWFLEQLLDEEVQKFTTASQLSIKNVCVMWCLARRVHMESFLLVKIFSSRWFKTIKCYNDGCEVNFLPRKECCHLAARETRNHVCLWLGYHYKMF
jgi:hypothetical protein